MEVEELKAIVENGFKDLSTRMQAGFADVDARMQAGFANADARIADIDARMQQGFTQVEDRIHQTQVLVEHLADDVKQVGEGVVTHHAEFRRDTADTERRFDDIDSVLRNYRDARRKRATGRAKPSR